MQAFIRSSMGRYVLKQQEKPVPQKCGYARAACFLKNQRVFFRLPEQKEDSGR